MAFRIEDDLLEHPAAVGSHFEACIAHGIIVSLEQLGDLIDHYMERYLRKSYDKQELIDKILAKHPNIANLDGKLAIQRQSGDYEPHLCHCYHILTIHVSRTHHFSHNVSCRCSFRRKHTSAHSTKYPR